MLLAKYYRFTIDVKSCRLLQPSEQGRFSYRVILFEFIIAQDVVISNLSGEQEQELLWLSLAHKELKEEYMQVLIVLACLDGKRNYQTHLSDL